MQGNGIDGMGVVTDRTYLLDPNNSYKYIGPIENNNPALNLAGDVNQTVDAVWDSTDLTYVLRGTVVLGDHGVPTPNTGAFTTEQSPSVTLTIQAALPGTLLADGSTIPSPGQSVIVKLLNDQAPNGAGSLSGLGSQGLGADAGAGAGFAVGVDDGVDPTSPSPL